MQYSYDYYPVNRSSVTVLFFMHFPLIFPFKIFQMNKHMYTYIYIKNMHLNQILQSYNF